MCGCEKVLPRLLVLKWDIAHMSATALKKELSGLCMITCLMSWISCSV